MNTAFYSVKISSGGSKWPISGQLKEKHRDSSSLYNGNAVAWSKSVQLKQLNPRKLKELNPGSKSRHERNN